MIAIVFKINLSTTLFNQTEQRMSLVCFQTFSIGKNVPCLFVFDPCANRHHPYRWLQHAFQISQHHVCSEIFILHNKTLNTNWRRLKTTISLVTLLYFFVNSDTIKGTSVVSKMLQNKSASMMPSKIQIFVAPLLLIPPQTCTLSGCLGFGFRFVGSFAILKQVRRYAWREIEHSSLKITLLKVSPLSRTRCANSNRLTLFASRISWQ